MRFLRCSVPALAVAGLLPGSVRAQDPKPGATLDDVMKELQELKRRDEEKQKQIDELQRQLDEIRKGKEPGAPPAAAPPPGEGAKSGMSEAEKKKLEEEFAKALAGDKKEAPPGAPVAAPAPRVQGALRLIDISFDLLATGGTSTAVEGDIRSLEGGGQDPKSRGFTLVNAELTLAGVVDPYFRGDANIIFQIDEEGETGVELEEAYLTTLSLPANLQVKAGQFFTDFGRHNPQHPHAWHFVDTNVVNSRLFGGDGVRNPGVQLSWLTPLPFFCELSGSVQNSHGETAFSFRNEPDEEFAGRVLVERDVKSAQDLLYLTRLKTSFDITDEVTVVPGASALFGPNGTARDRQTQIYGADFYLKWKPLTNDKGWPFVAWQSEVMLRRYEAGGIRVNDVDDDGLANGSLADGTLAVDHETLEDWGMYSQVVWGFARPWTIGLRAEYAAGEGTAYDLAPVFGVARSYDSKLDPLRDHRTRFSTALTHYFSEFSKLRLQYNYDRADFLEEDDAHSVYLQAEISFGAHGAHKF